MRSTLGNGSLLYQMGYYIVKDIDSVIYAEQQVFTPSSEDRLDIVQLLNKMFISFAVNQCHPRDLVVALYIWRKINAWYGEIFWLRT